MHHYHILILSLSPTYHKKQRQHSMEHQSLSLSFTCSSQHHIKTVGIFAVKRAGPKPSTGSLDKISSQEIDVIEQHLVWEIHNLYVINDKKK